MTVSLKSLSLAFLKLSHCLCFLSTPLLPPEKIIAEAGRVNDFCEAAIGVVPWYASEGACETVSKSFCVEECSSLEDWVRNPFSCFCMMFLIEVVKVVYRVGFCAKYSYVSFTIFSRSSSVSSLTCLDADFADFQDSVSRNDLWNWSSPTALSKSTPWDLSVQNSWSTYELRS